MKKYYLIGERLEHSFSAEIHRSFGRYDYELQELSPAELAPFLDRRDFAGLNVTIPYKEAVLPLLDRIDPAAAAIGAVNTVVKREGLLWGYNTDFGGMKAALARNDFEIKGHSVFVLGTGGTSKTALAVCQALGAAQIWRVSRTGREGALRYRELAQSGLRPDLIINCTPVGMRPDMDGLPLDLSLFDCRHSERPKEPASRRSEESAPRGLGERIATTSVRTGLAMTDVPPFCHSERSEESVSPVPASRLSAVFDCVYNPLRTRLVLEARARRIPAVGGLFMLVKQAALACELFTGAPVADEQLDILFDSLQQARESLVLIGMPGAGKTTVARLLAQKTGRKFVDIDEEIEKRSGKAISAIFAERGEAGFRELEAAVIRDFAGLTGGVIATGGGSVLRPENLRRLRQNGRLIFLDRPLEALLPSSARPLGDTAEKVAALYAERYDIYLRAAELHIPVTGTPEDAAEAVLAAL